MADKESIDSFLARRIFFVALTDEEPQAESQDVNKEQEKEEEEATGQPISVSYDSKAESSENSNHEDDDDDVWRRIRRSRRVVRHFSSSSDSSDSERAMEIRMALSLWRAIPSVFLVLGAGLLNRFCACPLIKETLIPFLRFGKLCISVLAMFVAVCILLWPVLSILYVAFSFLIVVTCSGWFNATVLNFVWNFYISSVALLYNVLFLLANSVTSGLTSGGGVMAKGCNVCWFCLKVWFCMTFWPVVLMYKLCGYLC